MNNPAKTCFFCGIGGSGMSPLALMMRARGHNVRGSDRAYDRGDSPNKFRKLQKAGIELFPQDGSGVTGADFCIASSAVEKTIPDIAAALEQGIPIVKRGELLAELFNESKTGIAVAGTSGKSTVTGMIAVMLTETGHDPTVMNGGVILNNGAAMRAGAGDLFVTETDESDATIAYMNPAIAVLNNIALDHKSFDELDTLFGDFISRATKAVILNIDDEKVRAIQTRAKAPLVTYAIDNKVADLIAADIEYFADGAGFNVSGHPVRLAVPGRHNVMNALAALSVARALDIPLDRAIPALEKFKGIARRLETVGNKNGITVIDDFGHNPDKIAATLRTLKEFDGLLLVMFQPHGFGPMKMMGRPIIEAFAEYLGKDDILALPEIYYAGGTAQRTVTSKDMVEWAKAKGVNAFHFATRAEIAPFLVSQAKQGDRIVIMGARDDSLSDFAREILQIL